MTLAQAQALFSQVLSLKATYQELVAQNPGVAQGSSGTVGQALQSITDQADTVRQQLDAGGYGEAADILVSDDEQEAAAWAAANPDLGGPGSSGTTPGTVPLTYTQTGGGSTTGSGSGVQLSATGSPTSSSSGSGSTWGGIAKSFVAALGDLFGGISGALANPSTYGQELGSGVASVGTGFGSALSSAGQGLGSGASAAGSGASSGLSQAAPWIIGGLVAIWAIKGYRVTKRTNTTRTGRALL